MCFEHCWWHDPFSCHASRIRVLVTKLWLNLINCNFHLLNSIKITSQGASLVAQWLGVRLPMQGTWVRALVWEDPTCRRATKPMCHNYWACAIEPASHNYWVRVPQLLKPVCLEPVLRNKRSHHNEKPVHRNKE